MKVVLRIFLVFTLLCPQFVFGQNNQSVKITAKIPKLKTVVIDPGHGGRHPGCMHDKFMEKDLTLSIATKLGTLIKKNFPDVKVLYTRTKDNYVDLDQRGNMANKAGADLFISIHINSSSSPALSGTSTYVMGLDKSGKNLEVAMKENDVVIYEKDYSTKYEGYTPGDASSYITFSLMQSAYLEQSMLLAEIVQKHYNHDLKMKDLGARQAPFLVLWKTSMPAILTEIGFLSNDRDRSHITTTKGQNNAARSLFNAFSEYKSRIEGKAKALVLKDKSEPVATQTASDFQGDKESNGGATIPDIRERLTAEQRAVAAAAKEVDSTEAKAQQVAAVGEGGSTDAKVQQVSGDSQAVGADRPLSAEAMAGQAADSGIKFYIQIASLCRTRDTNSTVFKSCRGKITIAEAADGTYKYLIGGYPRFAEVIDMLQSVRKEFGDAFVVAFEGTRLIALSEARRKTD